MRTFNASPCQPATALAGAFGTTCTASVHPGAGSEAGVIPVAVTAVAAAGKRGSARGEFSRPRGDGRGESLVFGGARARIR
jgi:hypothetical protein